MKSTSSLGSWTPSVFEFSLQECVYFCVCVFFFNNFAFAFVVYYFTFALGLCCCTGFLPVQQAGATLGWWCTSFSLPWFLLLQSTGSRVFRLQ